MKNIYYIFGGVLLLASAAVRLLTYNTITSDYTYFIAKWINELATHTWLTAFKTPFADYSPLYIYFLKILTFIPVYTLYSEKTLSFLFDLVIAYCTYLILRDAGARPYTNSQLFFFAAVMLAIPTMIANTSLWGQSDSVYAAGVIACLYFILRDKPLGAAFAFGFAISIKLQAIFFLPILVGFYLRRGLHELGYLLLIPALYILSIIPAWLGGGSFKTLLFTYFNQSTEYTDLSVSAQSIFAFFTYLPLTPSVRDVLFWGGVTIAGLSAIGIAFLVSRIPPERTAVYKIIFLSLLCVLVIPYFLPRMHERYFYLADMLSVIYAFYRPQHWYLPFVIVLSSLFSYTPFLSGQIQWMKPYYVDLRVSAVVLLLTIVAMVIILLRDRKPVFIT
jgi:Gpi18-like mannosyltransferase